MSNKISDTSSHLMEHAAQTADQAIQGTQRLASEALEGVSHSLQTVRKQVYDGANQVSDRTITYIRDEPVKSMLIAAATGAALMALARVVTRPTSSY